MAEIIRPRLIEYYNPRPLILGVCFCGGMIAGFFLYLLRTPEMPGIAQPIQTVEGPAAPPNRQRGIDRRQEGVPAIAGVEPTPAPIAGQRPNFETMGIDPPPVALTTEGGLTGKNARPIDEGARRSLRPTETWNRVPPAIIVPPPLPDLMP
ncbi:MAG: hypothetical protein LBE84_02770 [Planctomycetota bacterium]|jgi:hypothetical protein|nr:hypothetical protein [Planctomycetota bacterium]